ncbi:MAG: sigma-54 dependent transcriptional regulator [Gemmatimonadaceae bacterium]|nr:sigma-54 dependent transcriptional regulator [Gemmatimonadaceae bacterium]
MPSVLIVDDEVNIRRMVGALLGAEGYEVRDAADGASGLAAITASEPDIALVDLMMPGPIDGLALLERVRDTAPGMPVVMMSGRAGLPDAVRATKAGAFTFLEKPLTPEGVLLALSGALALRQARRTAEALRADLALDSTMIGESIAMRAVRSLIARIAPTDARVLITGESGTGKELVASALHYASARRTGPFVRVNCAAIPRDLVESEMFGHERGAFTGATERRIGRFELAHTGTLLLDEIGDLALDAQAKLLRAIESREIERVGGSGATGGGTRPIGIDVRTIAATNRDLERAVHDGGFREDLYFRLNVMSIALPPLRERADDVPALVLHFLARHRARTGQAPVALDAGAMDRLARHPWPGNVRELANVIERLAILHAGNAVGPSDVEQLLGARPILSRTPTPMSVLATNGHGVPAVDALPALPLSDALDAYERALIVRALELARGSVADAARRLRTDRPNLYRRMRRLGVTPHEERVASGT